MGVYDFLQEGKWRASVTDFLISLEELAPDLQYREQKLSYENRLEIASRIYEALRLFYPDRIVVLSDTTAPRLEEPFRDTKEKD
jgi:hypothetical protein